MRIVQGLYRVKIPYHAEMVEYLINPSREEFLALMKRVWDPVRLGGMFSVNGSQEPYEAPEDEINLKGVLVPGKPETLYVFDPIELHHWDFILGMGISKSPEEVPYAISLVLSKDDVEVDVYPDDYPLKFNFKKNLEAPAKKSQALKRIYGSNPNVHMEFHEKVF